MLHGALTNKISVNVKDSIVVNQVAAATLTSLHDIPTGGAYLKLTVSGGTSNSGSIIINGNVDGVLTPETVAFTAARW